MAIRDSMKKGTAELVVLHLLRSGRKYGYQIAQEISTRSGGLFTLQEGSLYPTLYRLEKNGYVISQTEFSPNQQRVRKYYSITDAGKAYFLEVREEYRQISEGIEKNPSDRGPRNVTKSAWNWQCEIFGFRLLVPLRVFV